MNEQVITVAEAARGFEAYVDRCHHDETTFVLVENGKPVAKLVPAFKKRGTGRELAKALGKVRLTSLEALEWQDDLKTARNSLKPPSDKWKRCGRCQM